MASNNNGYIIDSSVWVALFLESDPQHKDAERLIKELGSSLVYMPYVILSETVTVLAYRHSKKQADAFLEYTEDNSSIIFIDNNAKEERAFYSQIKKRLSFADAVIVYISQKYGLSVLTFDRQLRGVLKNRK